METIIATYELLRSLTGRRLEVLDCLVLLKIDSGGRVFVLCSLFCVIASEYEDRLGDLWTVKGDLPSKGIPTLVKLTPRNFACNTSLRGTSREEFEVHVTALNSIHLRNLNTYAHEVA